MGKCAEAKRRVAAQTEGRHPPREESPKGGLPGVRTSGNAAKWPQGAAVGWATHQTGNDRARVLLCRLEHLCIKRRAPNGTRLEVVRKGTNET